MSEDCYADILKNLEGLSNKSLTDIEPEIRAILRGEIDQDSGLAKSLAITNDQVKQWRVRGELTDKLTNAIAHLLNNQATN